MQNVLECDPEAIPAARVLMVDDNPLSLRLLRAMLGPDGFDVVAADSGQAAIDLVKANPGFDVILLDVAMPDLNGIEVCRRLKSDPETRHVPILLVSAPRTSDETLQTGLEAGADGYLTKPLDETVLRDRVKALLRPREP